MCFYKKTKPWSKLKKALLEVIDTSIDFDIHCSVHNPHIKHWPEVRNGRLWIVVGKDKKNVWDFPNNISSDAWGYEDMEGISNLIREYIDTPREELLTGQLEDKFQLLPILRASDRRIGKRRLLKMLEESPNELVKMIIRLRLDTNVVLNVFR